MKIEDKEFFREGFENWYIEHAKEFNIKLTPKDVEALRGDSGDYIERAALHGKWIGWLAAMQTK